MLHIVVFSKDRPAQLDALLHSLWRYVAGECRVSVVYRSTDSGYDEGYGIVRERFPTVRLSKQQAEGDFAFLTSLTMQVGYNSPLTMFMVDDGLLRRTLTVNDSVMQRLLENRPHEVCISTRLGKHITHCYMQNDQPTPPPTIENNCFDRTGLHGDWGYLHSLDGNIYRTDEAIQMVRAAKANSPNILAYRLNEQAKPEHTHVLCYDIAPVIGIPHNRVQDVFKGNRYNGGRAMDLLTPFLNGSRILTTPFTDLVNNTTHVNAHLTWYMPGEG